MSLSVPTVHRAVVGALATGAISGAMLFGSAAIAVADPPNCTAADLARVASGFRLPRRTTCPAIPMSTLSSPVLRARATMCCATTRRTTSTPTPRYKLTFKASVSLWLISRLAANRHMRQPPVYFL